ncbi:MAG: response regulator [Burkholderiales bacterium]
MDVLLVDDHPVIHETLRTIVHSVRPGADFFGQFDLESGLVEAKRMNDLGLVLLDLGLPGYAGMDALIRFRTEIPRARVAVISADDDEDQVRAPLKAGAVGYLPKTLLPMAMAEAIRVILDGGSYRPTG